MLAIFAETPGEQVVDVSMMVGGKRLQRAAAVPAAKPESAPILHFNGPLTVGFHSPWFYGTPALTRGNEPSRFTVVIGTPGLGEGTFAVLNAQDVVDGKPVVEIDFPPGTKGGEPIRHTVTLNEQC